MNNRLIRIIIVIMLSIAAATCKREDAIIQSKFATASITAFTVDSLLFSITINNSLVVDSVASPVGSASKQFLFYDTVAHLQVYEKNSWNRIVIDTNIRTHIGTNYINIVQFNSEEKPVLPPVPNEPLPAAGYCKVKLVYAAPSGAPYRDSVKCEILIDASASGNGSALYPADTIILSRYEFGDRYYVVKKSTAGFRIKVYDPVSNALIQQTSFGNTSDYTDFNTVGLMATAISASTVAYNLARVF